MIYDNIEYQVVYSISIYNLYIIIGIKSIKI